MNKLFQLVVHDFLNMTLQIVHTSEDRKTLDTMANNLNWMFDNSGCTSNFQAEVSIIELKEGGP